MSLLSPLRTQARVSRRTRLINTSSHIINIPTADVYRFGAASDPIFRHVSWTVNDGEHWAVLAAANEKDDFFQMLLGHRRISPHPPPPGLYPGLSKAESEFPASLVSFGNRRRSGGAFYDYTARYGAVQDQDRITLRQHMFPETIDPYGGIPEILRAPGWEKTVDVVANLSPQKRALFESLVQQMGLAAFLDIPLIALSNGQTRRARILKAIWGQPQLLLLDEPLTGLDVDARPKLLDTLHNLRNPRVILGLRKHDVVPDWITHLAFLRGTTVKTGSKEEILADGILGPTARATSTPIAPPRIGEMVADLQNVSVKYEERQILKKIDWQIRQGERWHLQGANGSGKTTLMALLTGDHPQSYTQKHLHLFGRPRSRIATPQLQSLIGVVSPEMFDAFPRRAGMLVQDVVGTGFDGTFVARGKHGVGTGIMQNLSEQDLKWRVKRREEVVSALQPSPEFGKREFVDLGVGEQRIVLLMRALVGRPQLVLLDEVWSGMDESMVNSAKRYLREGGGVNDEQAVVVVTHWEQEVPWSAADGLKRIRLDRGTSETTVQEPGLLQ